MDIRELVEGKEYKRTHAYGQPDQKIKVLRVSNEDGYLIADIIYTSDDCTKGLRTTMNAIECERYIHPLDDEICDCSMDCWEEIEEK